ncbi:MAG: hypothetical protein AAGE43_00515 [Pseudomonadota bacterium]
MNCSEVILKLDDYLDGVSSQSIEHHGLTADRESAISNTECVDDRTAAAMALHVQGCPSCTNELEARQTLRDDLKALPIAAAEPELMTRLMNEAISAGETVREQNQKRRAIPRRGAAISALAATVLAAWLLVTLVTAPPPVQDAPEAPALPQITLAADTVTPVKLAFSAEEALADAELSLSLPVGVELVGYDGQSDLSWQTTLEAGTNVLRLPLVGRTAGTDVLIARLSHPKGTKTFRLKVAVNDNGAEQ